jgi:hypothetical protein
VSPDVPPEIALIVEELEAASWRITWKGWHGGTVEFSGTNTATKRVVYVMCSEKELLQRLEALRPDR